MLDKLSLLTLNPSQILSWKKELELTRQKRLLRELNPNCNTDVFGWSYLERVAASTFVPWVAAAKPQGELSHLECWLGKQANLTSKVLAQRLEDDDSIRHTTLQNRAAIDYLLSLHGHGCEQFEGLCCFNIK